jgi:hypothetical protein
MKFFGKSKDSDRQKNSVLFVCIENAEVKWPKVFSGDILSKETNL